jgi:hypothetical protein
MREHGLQPGDQVIWVPQADGEVLLKFNPAQAAHEGDVA